MVTSEGHGLKGQPGPGSNPGQGRLSEAPLPRDEGAPGPRDATAVPQVPPSAPPPLTCGLLVPKPSVGVVGTDMEWGPIGELMTEKGGPMPLMGECSCPGEPSGAPRPGPNEGCSEGAAMEPRPVGELRGEEFTWVEKSARQEAQEAVRTPQMGLLPRPEAMKESQAQASIPSIPRGSPTPIPSNTARPGQAEGCTLPPRHRLGAGSASPSPMHSGVQGKVWDNRRYCRGSWETAPPVEQNQLPAQSRQVPGVRQRRGAAITPFHRENGDLCSTPALAGRGPHRGPAAPQSKAWACSDHQDLTLRAPRARLLGGLSEAQLCARPGVGPPPRRGEAGPPASASPFISGIQSPTSSW